jgi:hypothetical protein
MDNDDMVVLNVFEMTIIWGISWKLDTKWLMYNDMGNVMTTYLPIYITTHFGFCNWPLQIHTNKKGHMRLVINELLNPCCFTHLIAKDVQL